MRDAGADGWHVARRLFVDLGCGGENALALSLQTWIACHSDTYRVVWVECARLVVELADDIEGNLAGEAGWIIHPKQADEPIHGNAVIVLGLDEWRLGIGQRNLGLQHVETGHCTGIIAVLLIFQLLGQEVHRLLVSDDERAVQNNLGEVDFHLGDHLVNDGPKLEVGSVLAGDRGADTGNGGAAVIEELSEFQVDIPHLVGDVRAGNFDLI